MQSRPQAMTLAGTGARRSPVLVSFRVQSYFYKMDFVCLRTHGNRLTPHRRKLITPR